MRLGRSSVPSREDRRSPSIDPPSYDASMSASSSFSGEQPPAIIRQSSSNLLRTSNAPSPSLAPVSPPLRPVSRTSGASPAPSGASVPSPIKHVPYRPSKELQSHIDNTLSSVVSPLSLVSSNTRTEYFDMLPSFQMFQSILKRDNSQFSENLTIEPPVYGDTTNSVPTPPSLSRQGSYNTTNDHNNTHESHNNNEYFYQQRRDNNLDGDDSMQNLLERLANVNNSSQRLDDDHEYNQNRLGQPHPEGESYTHNEAQITASHDTYGHTVLDNIDKLPKLHNSPIDIQIYVTKRVPQPHVSNELETRLKEYSIGDMVNGYIIITNTSDEPVDFGLFIVTLEGTVKATERVNSPNSIDHGKVRRMLMKKFLKMYDFNASYGYGYIPSSSGVEYDPLSLDEFDGSIFGLPDERILQPHQKYKKYFTFRFPEKLLDNSCINSVLTHVLPPPSFGVDKTCFFNKGSSILLNKALGYGFLNTRGTPLLTKDFAFDDVSVSYTIEAKFIDKLNDKAKDPMSHLDINDQIDVNVNDYVISRSSQYFLRFIPDLNKSIEYFNLDSALAGYDTFASIGIDGKLYQRYLTLSTWKDINELNQRVQKEIELKLRHDEMNDSEIKHKNLIIRNTNQNAKTNDNFNIKSRIMKQLEFHRTKQFDVDDNLYYHDERMIGNADAVTIVGKKKKKILSSIVNIGTLKLFVRIPSKPFPYTSPKLLMKYNFGSELTTSGGSPLLSPMTSHELGTHVTNNAFSPVQSRSIDTNLALSPVNSGASVLSNDSSSGNSSTGLTGNHMMALYHRDHDQIQDHIDISLVFNPIDNSTQPPKISFVETNVVSWTWNTEYPLPLSVGYDFFYCSPESESLHCQDEGVKSTRENFQNLKDMSSNYLEFLDTNNITISKEAFLYLKALQTLTFKKDIIKDYFQTFTQTNNANLLNNENDWKAKQSLNHQQNLLWTKSIRIPLTPTHKNNINLIPSFQTCLVGRVYSLQIVVKYKGSGSDQKDSTDNVLRMEVPIFVG